MLALLLGSILPLDGFFTNLLETLYHEGLKTNIEKNGHISHLALDWILHVEKLEKYFRPLKMRVT